MLLGLLQSLLLITLSRHNLIGSLLAIETILILSYSIAARLGSASNMTEATGLLILAVSIGAIEAAIGLAISAVYRNIRMNLNLSMQTLLVAKPMKTPDNHL
uniref:NADH dehydrogenase subunit 4L n=1 Tax=Rhodosorus marinus TaxID=101924 RepID=A0A7S2ZDJ3_9RHOD|mmetsp:Transcript_14950/g.60963  ORF Transcript_14950/g.60963 Transcript_14950/m.60963 type:complete len:102 (+) Transcript_14950:392-697(+)